jgi:hypothetical protein
MTAWWVSRYPGKAVAIIVSVLVGSVSVAGAHP